MTDSPDFPLALQLCSVCGARGSEVRIRCFYTDGYMANRFYCHECNQMIAQFEDVISRRLRSQKELLEELL